MRSSLVVPAAGIALGAAAGAAYARWLKPRHDRWGATDAEVAADLPGDDLLAEPATQNTRAVTIDAPAAAVWPWLVQIGADRGGFYSYDWLEDLFGLGIHSSDVIVPEWQHLEVGDVVHADARRRGGWYVVRLHPGETLVLQVGDLTRGTTLQRSADGWEFQWTFALRPAGPGRCRLLVRERVAFATPAVRTLMAPVGPVSFVMTRRMLLGIKERAERATPRLAPEPVEIG